MRTPRLRSRAALAALALVAMAATAACGAAPVRPLPVQNRGATPGGTAPASTAPTTATPANAAPTGTARGGGAGSGTVRPVHTNRGPTCLGATTYTIRASDTGRDWPRLCIAVGGVLRVENLGPEGFAQRPSGRTACEYEAAVRTCRLIHTGTVRFTIDNGRAVRSLTLDIVAASSPPTSSPACLDARSTFRLDANDGGPPWSALCMRLGAVLRVENLGPGGLSVAPTNLATCAYEAAVHRCRLVRAGTGTFTVTGVGPARSLIVVAIR